MVISIIVYFLFFIRCSHALNNGLGRTPQMGWNSWNHFGCGINEAIVRQTADAMVATGLAAAGYQYVNMDDCWQVSRDANGTIQPDPKAFPSGIPALTDYVHSKKLKFGLYSDRGNMTCQRRPGSLGYETKDANTYAAWGVDYLKLDSCYTNGTPAVVEYSIMRDALNATGRPIFFSLCGGVGSGDIWPPSVGNSWRTTNDIQDNWASMISNINHNNDCAARAGPGGWNDPDMLEIGNGHMTTVEYMTHFSLWSITKAPLIIGCDVTKISAADLSILTNSEVIAVNQDPLGIQGKKVAVTSSLSSNGSTGVIVQPELEIWAGPLTGGSQAVVLLNGGDSGSSQITVQWTDISFPADHSALVRDLWAHKDLGIFTGNFTSPMIDSHAVMMLNITLTK